MTVSVDVSDRFHDCRVVELFRFCYWRVQCSVVICSMVGSSIRENFIFNKKKIKNCTPQCVESNVIILEFDEQTKAEF